MDTRSANTFLRFLLVSALMLLTPRHTLAQIGGAGSIQGVVTDATGAVIPGAIVIATNVATGVKTQRQATEAGFYVITPLPAGEYTVTASVAGFKPIVQEKVIVDALSTVAVNLSLQIGAVSETVTVSEAPTPLNTSDARLGVTIRNEL
jgi:hypothetical protein